MPESSAVLQSGSRASCPTVGVKPDTFIEIDHVTFGYDERRTILNDLSLCFKRGKVTAVLGGSGWGSGLATLWLMRARRAKRPTGLETRTP